MPTDSRHSLRSDDLGRRIKDARNAIRKTQKQASLEARIAQSTWASLEAGSRSVSEKTLKRVLKVVGIPFTPGMGLSATATAEAEWGICANPRCFINQVLRMDGEYRFLPSLQPARGKACAHCGGALITACQNSECKQKVDGPIGPFCENCGLPWARIPEGDKALEGSAKEITSREEYLEALKSANAVFVDKSVPE